MSEVAKEVLLDEEGSIIERQPEPEARTTEIDEEGAEDTRLVEDEHHDGGEDEPGAEGETEDEAEARRARNRQRRAENKARRKDYIEQLRREIAARDDVLNQQAARLEALERRTHGADISAVDNELRKSVDAYNFYKQQHAEAVTRADGQLAADAQEKMFAAMNRAQQLNQVKQAAQRQPMQPQPLDPRLKAQADVWLERNSWYDPTGSDPDSQIALTVDQQMAREGWNPTTPQYWEELDSRLKKYLPHKYSSGYNSSKGNGRSPRAPVASSSRESQNASNKGGYMLSPERVQAIKDAGMWDDPAKRAAMVKRYQQIDRENANG